VSSLARLCFRRRFVVLGGWILLLMTLIAAARSAGTAFTDSTGMPDVDAKDLGGQVSGDPHDQGCGLDVGRDLARETEDVAVGLDGLGVVRAHVDLSGAQMVDRLDPCRPARGCAGALEYDPANQLGPPEETTAGTDCADVEPAVVGQRARKQGDAARQQAAVCRSGWCARIGR
jgi:hypothetical protein